MSALFNFQSFLTVVLLVICTCTYIKLHFPAVLEHRTGFRGFFWKAARIGERLSPWVAAGCLTMGLSILFFWTVNLVFMTGNCFLQPFLLCLSRKLATLLITCIFNVAKPSSYLYQSSLHWDAIHGQRLYIIIAYFSYASFVVQRGLALQKLLMQNLVNYWIFSCPIFWERILFLVSPLSFWRLLYQAMQSRHIYNCTNY